MLQHSENQCALMVKHVVRVSSAHITFLTRPLPFLFSTKLPFSKLPLLSFSELTESPGMEAPGSSLGPCIKKKCISSCFMWINATHCAYFFAKLFRNCKAGNWRVLATQVKAVCLLQQYSPTSWFCFPVICSGFASGPLSSPSAKYLLIDFVFLSLWEKCSPFLFFGREWFATGLETN